MNYKFIINPSYISFQDFLINIKRYFTDNDTTIHKARNELKIIQFQEISTVVKSFKIPNIINKIAYTYFRDSKAKKSYNYALKIEKYTPKPIGYIEFYTNELLDESFFISEEFSYDFTIRKPLLDKNFESKDAIFKAFARFTLELHNDGIFHNDYSPGNILIKKSSSGYIFKVVDINRMKFMHLDEDMRAKNFAKLWANDTILKVIAEEYSKYYHCSPSFEQTVLEYSNKNKKIKNFKKRLKGKPVND